jgi:hypothetical protein
MRSGSPIYAVTPARLLHETVTSMVDCTDFCGVWRMHPG